jgi:hypothetical protein
MRLLILYGMLYSVSLDCLGSCLTRWRACLLVGGREVALIVLLFGIWFLFASFGAYGQKGMRDALRTLRDLWRILRPSFSTHFALEQQHGLLF